MDNSTDQNFPSNQNLSHAGTKHTTNGQNQSSSPRRRGLAWYSSALLIGSVATWLLLWPAFQNVRDGFSTSSWASTEATVTSSRKTQSSGGSGARRTTYRFRYEFEFDDKKHTGWRYSLAYPSGRQALGVRKHDVGDKVTIRYNSDHPSRSVVDVEASNWWNYVVLGGSLFISFFAYRRLH